VHHGQVRNTDPADTLRSVLRALSSFQRTDPFPLFGCLSAAPSGEPSKVTNIRRRCQHLSSMAPKLFQPRFRPLPDEPDMDRCFRDVDWSLRLFLEQPSAARAGYPRSTGVVGRRTSNTTKRPVGCQPLIASRCTFLRLPPRSATRPHQVPLSDAQTTDFNTSRGKRKPTCGVRLAASVARSAAVGFTRLTTAIVTHP
jgi:hypothetical protein